MIKIISSSSLLSVHRLIIAFIAFISLLTIISYLLPVAAHAQSATLSLNPSTGTFNRGCPFSLDIDLNTGGVATDGTDAILSYDQSRFTATSITTGTIYQEYPGSSVDDSQGKVVASGVASITQSFTGTGTLATVNFLVKDNAQTGATQISFDFDPADKSKTSDSNVVTRATGTVTDILGTVVNGNYTVGTGSCEDGTAGTGVGGKGGTIATPSGGIEEIPIKTLPPAGSEQLTFTLAIIGSVLTFLGILGLALL